MKALKIFFAVLLVCLLSSCGGTEPNDVAYVVAIGFDKAENKNYMITLQFARPTQISGGASEEGGEGTGIVENMAVEAPDVHSAISLANRMVSKELRLSHAKLIVFSQSVAEDGVGEIMDSVIRDEELRPDIYLAVSRGDARDYLYEVKPVVEVNPAKYYQLIFEQNDSAGIPKTTGLDFCFNNSGGRANVLPIAGIIGGDGGNLLDDDGLGKINRLEGKENSAERSEESNEGENPKRDENGDRKNAPPVTGGFEYRLRDYIAGQLAINEKNKTEAVGMAVFQNDRAAIICGAVETELYEIMSGDFRSSFINIEMNEKPLTLKITQDRKPKIKCDVKNQVNRVKLYIDADLYSVSDEKLQNIEKEAGEEIEEACKKLLRELTAERGYDILGFGNKAKFSFLTNEDMGNIDVCGFDTEVECEFNIRRTGLNLTNQ